ncbi:MAG: AAA family ATPase, partial [Oceanobacter sp.]
MSQILATKLFPPFLRPGRVRRERLLSHLNLGIHGKLTLVSAPAGFGKSTLLAEFASQMAEQQGYQTAWLSLDEGDSDVRRFFQYLVAALQTLEKGEVKTFGQDALALVQASPEGMPEQALTQLLNDLYGLQQPTLLVLDDYHLLDGADVNGLLQRLLEHWPGQVHLAIGTREDPALPLARMRARGEVNEVRASDLRFSVEESGTFMAETMKVPLGEAEVEALETRTEGWIAGLQLAGVSLQRSPDRASFLKEFTGSHRFVLDYLTEEVLQTQSGEVRQFLLQASIFERFSAGLCEAVTGLANCGEILRQLEQGNLFLVALDHQGQWFRFHHLFADMLASQRSLSDDELQGIYARASGWFASQNMVTDAVHYGLLAKDYDSVADLLDLHWIDMGFYSMERDLIDWVEALPESVWQHRPVIRGFYAMAVLSYDRPKGTRLLRATWEQVQAGGEHLVVRNQQAMATLPGLIAIGEAYLAGSEGNDEQVLHWASVALQRLPEDDVKWRGAVLALQGTVHWGIGDLDQACDSIAGCLHIMDECGDLAGLMSSYYLLAAAKVSQGEIREGRRLIELAFEKLEELKPLQPQGSHEVWALKAELAFIDGDIEAARKALEVTD